MKGTTSQCLAESPCLERRGADAWGIDQRASLFSPGSWSLVLGCFALDRHPLLPLWWGKLESESPRAQTSSLVCFPRLAGSQGSFLSLTCTYISPPLPPTPTPSQQSSGHICRSSRRDCSSHWLTLPLGSARKQAPWEYPCTSFHTSAAQAP